jgi:hypothetical protein
MKRPRSTLLVHIQETDYAFDIQLVLHKQMVCVFSPTIGVIRFAMGKLVKVYDNLFITIVALHRKNNSSS